ncbi:MAG: prephenate dehydratase [Muribaculaceae bacterium]
MEGQKGHKVKVAIQGVAGCFHDAAAHAFFAGCEVETVEFDTFYDLFQATALDPELYGIVAIENTIAGSILPNYELLRKSNLRIIGEYKMRISHVLCALPGETIESLSEVNSHPMALMQCEEYLRQYPHLKIIEKTDTAGSAQEIASKRLSGHAAVCGEYAAELYGLNILQKGIETNKRNFTRFLILDHDKENAENANKASIVFTLPHTRGALSKVLTILTFYDINLSKIQSLPVVGSEWEYRFYVDLTYDDSERYHQALQAVAPLITDFKTLGEYAEFSYTAE